MGWGVSSRRLKRGQEPDVASRGSILDDVDSMVPCRAVVL